MTWIRNSGGAPLSGAAVDSMLFGRPGANIGTQERWNPIDGFINYVRAAEEHWFPGGGSFGSPSPYENSLGWITNLPNGSSVELPLKYTEIATMYIKPGQYKATTASGATVLFLGGSGITSNSTGTNLATCTIAVQGSNSYTVANGYDWYVRLTNNTGSAISINDVAVFHVDDEADHLAGRLWRSEYLLQLRNKRVVRVLDQTLGNMKNEFPQEYRQDTIAKIPTESNRFWGAIRMPPTVAGKLMNELAAKYPGYPCAMAALHVCLPPMMSPWRYTATAATDRYTVIDINGSTVTHGYTDGTVLVVHGFGSGTYGGLTKQTVPYYVINATATDFQLSTSAGGAAINVTADVTGDWGFLIDRADRDYLAFYTAWMELLLSVRPTGKTKPECNNEPWNSQFAQHHWLHGAPAWQIGLAANGARAQAHLQLVVWKAALDAGLAEADLIRGFNCQVANDGFFTNAELDHLDVGVFSAGTAFSTLLQAGANPGEQWQAPYTNPADLSNVHYTSAQLVSLGADAWTDQQWLDAMLRGNISTAATMAARKANLATKAPAAKLSTYECGQHIFSANVTGAAAVHARFQTWLYTSHAQTWLADYRQKVFVENDCLDMVYLTLNGGWRASPDSAALSQWGLRPSADGPSTTMADWFNAL